MSHLTYSTPIIFANNEDKQKIVEILLLHRDAWNECSPIVFGLSKKSIILLHSQFYQNCRKKQEKIPAQVVIRAEQECLSAYKSIKTNKHILKFPAVKTGLSMRLDKRMFSQKDGVYSIISTGKRVKCRPHLYPKLEELLKSYYFCDPLIYAKNDQIWIALTFKVPDPIVSPDCATGIDLGIRQFAATSEGHLYQDKQFLKEKRRLRFQKRQLQRAIDTKKSRSAKRKQKKIRRKEANKNRNFSHHLANALINNTKSNILVLENLKSIKVKKHKYQNKNRISQVPLFELKTISTYKTLLHKKQVITVCPSYTSQIDHRTEKRDGVRKGRRYYGNDGKVLDADINAAINIAKRSKLPVSIGNYLDGQATVTTPIVGRSWSGKPPTLVGGK